MEKQIRHSFKGLNRDTAKSKFSNELYFDAKNIRLSPTDSQTSGVLNNEKGNVKILTIPTPTIDYNGKIITYGTSVLNYTTNEINYSTQSSTQYIIAQQNIREGIVFITTDNNGFDCIWKFNINNYNITLLYLRNLGLSLNNPPQIINNFENEKVDKIYWVDSLHQLRFLNLNHSLQNKDLENIIDIPVGVIDMVGNYELSQPVISNILSGGTHTSGMIQYGYNLYRLNSSQTKISPLSELTPLDKGLSGGGKINEIVGALPVVDITNIDHNYSHIRVYAIKYTSYNEIPSISLIKDLELPLSGNIQIFDDGTAINTITLDEFLFLGSDIVIPKHINTKFNKLFLANYKEINFNVDLDTRAYSYNNTGTSIVYKDLTTTPVTITQPYYPYAVTTVEKPTGTPFYITTDSDYDNPTLIKHDSINLNYNVFKFQKNGTTYGGEGKYVKYELTKSTIFNPDNKYFKDDEIYRIGIEFFNNYGQVSLPNWIADFKALDGNLSGQYNTLSVTLKPEFFNWLNTTTFASKYDKPIGYKIIIADRTLNDRTIVANGLLSPMMINDKSTKNVSYPGDRPYVSTKADSLIKIPNILTRNYNASTTYGITQPLRKSLHLDELCTIRENPNTEIMRAYNQTTGDTHGRFYQFNSMLQLYSPEILFNNSVPSSEAMQVRIKGSLKNNVNNTWGRAYWGTTDSASIISNEGKVTGALSPHYGGIVENIEGGGSNSWNWGLISSYPENVVNKCNHIMYDRVYGGNVPSDINTGLYVKAPTSISYDIYGKPELTEKGSSGTNYNNDPKYRYSNSLESMLTDGNTHYDKDGAFNRQIVSVNSYGNRCVTLVLGNDSSVTTHEQRPTHESLGLLAGITGDNNGLIGEIVKSDNEIYLGNIYGGNSYEDKKRTNYIEIGSYNKLNSLFPTVHISSPGDTFVNFFKYARIVRTDKNIFSEGTFVLEELVTMLCETTVDLKNRSDLSFNDWKTRFQPLDAEYHNYNKVYSQQPTLIQRRDLNFNIKKNNDFDTNIISTKQKSAGELIDNWTDISVNDVMTLDGKYGAINSLINYNDEIYALQDQSLAFISINPRVQIQAEDGLSIQLGSGNVLDRYKYITTSSGTLNKWSVITTPNAFYYYDLINKSMMIFNNSLTKLSDTRGLQSFFNDETDNISLKSDNPINGYGITGGYDYINNELFLTFKQSTKPSFTISFNEKLNTFVSFYDFIPSLYISKGSNFLVTNSNNRDVYKQYAGEYNKFFGVYYPSYVTLNVNPEADKDCIFNNLQYKSEVYINNTDQPVSTLTSVQLWNEYQNSNSKPLVLHSNLSRKFRDWKITLPREYNSLNRIRNSWVFLKLQFDNTTNKQLLLHDVYINYTI